VSEPTDPVPQRIGDAERDQATTYLREALAQGRLDQAEFDERVDRALRAKTQADLDPLFRDLPGPKPGQGLASAAGFTAPPWQQGRPSPPPSDVAVPATARGPVARGGLSKTIDAIAWVIWPVTLLVLFATSWSYWWLIFIPIIVSSYAGKRRHDENEQRQIGNN
jgi:hypothetical protein